MKHLKGLLIATIAIIILAMMALITGCGGSSDAATGPVIWSIVPSCEGYDLGGSNNHFSGPAGKYSFVLVSAIGEVVPTRIDPTQEGFEYGFDVFEVTPGIDTESGNSTIRSITPDSSGLYDLSPPGSYWTRAWESDGYGATILAECKIITR